MFAVRRDFFYVDMPQSSQVSNLPSELCKQCARIISQIDIGPLSQLLSACLSQRQQRSLVLLMYRLRPATSHQPLATYDLQGQPSMKTVITWTTWQDLPRSHRIRFQRQKHRIWYGLANDLPNPAESLVNHRHCDALGGRWRETSWLSLYLQAVIFQWAP